jgi:uncharacterized membrane protein
MNQAAPFRQRIPLIDVARGLALVAMTIYHFGWDLDAFGWLDPGSATSGGWRLFARFIASSFLFLVGVSLVLAHGGGVRWQAFVKRWLQVVTAAALVSIASYVQVTWPQIDFLFSYARETGDWSEVVNPLAWPAPGSGFIFFGILHAIALFSLFALPFLRVPWWGNVLAAIAVLVVASIGISTVFDPIWLTWIGLYTVPVASNDHVPLFPWFAAVLTGMAAAQLGTRFGIWERMATRRSPAERPLTFIGRHSLIYYLVHQPVLIVGLWLFTTFVAQPDPIPATIVACERTCSAELPGFPCLDYCTCTITRMADIGYPFGVPARPITEAQREIQEDASRMCFARATDSFNEEDGQAD